ncbi:MAG: hypothetical protein R3C59_14580 [Planctomycetaceae bacterium]
MNSHLSGVPQHIAPRQMEDFHFAKSGKPPQRHQQFPLIVRAGFQDLLSDLPRHKEVAFPILASAADLIFKRVEDDQPTAFGGIKEHLGVVDVLPLGVLSHRDALRIVAGGFLDSPLVQPLPKVVGVFMCEGINRPARKHMVQKSDGAIPFQQS